MATRNVGPTKDTLLKVLKGFGYWHENESLSKDISDVEEEIEKFLKNSKEYQKLIKKQEGLNEKRSTLRTIYRNELQNLKNKVYLKGAIPEVVRDIEAFVEKYKDQQ